MENPPESQLGTSKEKPIEIDEEDESSDENSVIILDSDTEKEDNDREDGDNGDDEDEDLVDDEEDSEASDEESEEEDDDTDSSVDSDSVNSVWSDIGEAAGDEITQEAAEAKIVNKFEKAIIAIADGEVDKGRKILETILDDPIISCFSHEDLDFEVFEEPPRLAKMLQIFIATHKNLAKLCEKSIESAENQEDNKLQNEELQHLYQVLAYEPNNSEIWLDVAMKCVEFGDLNFAKYAFKRCENLKESMESHAALLYLTCDYSESLVVLKQYKEQNDVLNDKMKYLKHKIRDTNQYCKLLCDRIFEEDEVYADIDYVDRVKITAFDERINDLKRRMEKRTEKRDQIFKKEKELMSTIPIQISADQDLPAVCTLFCDLFDRIHNFSHCRQQLIEITGWESRKDYLQVVETVDKLVDIVECLEDLTQKVDESQKMKKGRRQRQQEKKDYLANWKKRLFIEKTADEVITLDSEANTTADEDEEVSQDEGSGGVPANELAEEFNLVFSDVVSIMTAERKREKTPPPSKSSEFISCDSILHLLEIQFSGTTHTILEIIENILILLSDHSPSLGALPENMKEVTREMYYRFALYSEIKLSKYHKINVFLMELDAKKSMELMILKYISPFWKEQKEDESDKSEKVENEENRSFVLRFMWKYTQSGLSDEIKLEHLQTLRSLLEPEESIPTSSGSFATWDVDIAIGELEKKKRIDSVKHLWKSKNYESLVEILQNDIDFSAIGIDETIEMICYWIQSLERMKSSGELLNMLARAMHFYLFVVENASTNTIKPERIEKNLEFLLVKVQRMIFKESFSVSRRRLPTISTIGYLICVTFKKYPKFEKDWKNWRILYEIVKTQRGDANQYIKSLDKAENPDAMPLLELDLLVKAHEVLGEHHCCAQNHYEFLLFIVDRIREVIDDVPFLEICYLKENGYLWNNMNTELSQILFCLFGKYSRKVRAQENHENGGKCQTPISVYKKIMGVILVQPLPLHDEKEKLTHDVVDLLNSKFPSFLEISKEKKERQQEFKASLQKAENEEEIADILRKCQDDKEDDTQSLVWYALAMSAYRQNSFKEATKYSELYLLTDGRVHYDRQRNSVWGMMAHACATDLLQLDLHEIYDQWKWRILPHRMAVKSHQNEPSPHFEIAMLQYQLATTLLRFQRHLPENDPRRQDNGDVKKLRQEAKFHFDKALELTKVGVDGSQPDHHWLCYFFSAKLESKSDKWDILKAVESFYEAACGCELLGFYYPQKVQLKKQQNFEPLEVHYQAFSAVYKYLLTNEMPDLDTLRALKTWMRLLTDGHKVVKPNSSLFKVNIDVYTAVDDLVMDTVFKEKEVERDTIPIEMSSELRSELVADLKEMCTRAFELVTDRFPHIKSFYRLAQLYLEKNEIDKASDQIFKNAFRRKKRDDGMFDNCIEISSNDINRNGSNLFHIARCVKIGAQIVQKTNDFHNAVSMLVTMVGIIAKDDDDKVEKSMWKSVVTSYVAAMEKIAKSRDNTSARSTPSPGPDDVPRPAKPHYVSVKSLRTELWRLWHALSKCSKPSNELIQLMKSKTLELINHHFKSVDELRSRMQPSNPNDPTKKNKNLVVKRKFDVMNVAAPFLKGIANQAGVSKHLNDIALKLQAQGKPSDKQAVYNEVARELLKNPELNREAIKNFAEMLQAMNSPAKSQAPSASQPSTSSAPKPPLIKPATTIPVVAPKPPVPPVPAVPTASTTSTAPKQQSLPTLSGPIRPVARYSPISSDDEVQCLDPLPAKRPAPEAPAAPSSFSTKEKSRPPGVTEQPKAAGPPKQMVPSVFGGLKAAPPVQTIPKVPANPVRPVAQSVQKPPATSSPKPQAVQPNPVRPVVAQKPSVSSAPKPQNPVSKPPNTVSKPQNSDTKSAESPLNPTFITVTPEARAQFDTIMKMNGLEDITQFIQKNINSTTPDTKKMAQQALLYLTEKQKERTIEAAAKKKAQEEVTKKQVEALKKAAQESAAKKAQAALQSQNSSPSKQQMITNQQMYTALLQYQLSQNAQVDKKVQAMKAKEKADQLEKERLAKIAQEKEKRRLEKLAKEAQAAQKAKIAEEAKKAQDARAAAQLAQLHQATSTAALMKMAQDAAQLKNNEDLQRMAMALSFLSSGGGMNMPSTSSAPNLMGLGFAEQLATAQKLAQAQVQAQKTAKSSGVQGQKASTSSPSRPIVVPPQVARPHPYKQPPKQPKQAQRLPSQPMRQSASTSSLVQQPNRPATNQQANPPILVTALEAEQLRRLDPDSLQRVLSSLNPDQRKSVWEQMTGKK